MTRLSPMILMKPKLLFCRPPSLGSLFKRAKDAQVMHLVLVPNICHPLFDMWRKPDTSNPTFVSGVSLLIKRVKQLGNISKIAPPVVRSVAVYVVNLSIGKGTCHQQERQAMRFVIFRANMHDNIAMPIKSPGLSSGIFSIPNTASCLRTHVTLTASKHVRRGSFVNKLACLWAICNPLNRIGFGDHSGYLRDYFMLKYASSCMNVKDATS